MCRITSFIPNLLILGMLGLAAGCQRSQSPETTPVSETGPITVSPALEPPMPPPPVPMPETPADLAQPLHLQEETVVVRQDSAVGTLKDAAGTNTLTVRAARFSSPESSEVESVVTVDLGVAAEAFLSPEQTDNLAKALDAVCAAQPGAAAFQNFRASYRSASELTVTCSDGHDEQERRVRVCRIEIAGSSLGTTTNGLQTLKSLLQEATRKLKEPQK